MICSHCRKPGHAQDTCFQLHGVPDWYKAQTDKKKNARHFAANVDEKQQTSMAGSSVNVIEMMIELIKLLQKNNTPSDPLTNYANFARFDEQFAGNTSILSEIELSCRIIDSGATNHICANVALFQSFVKSSQPQYIHLPDGTRKFVLYTGAVKLTNTITLEH
ncbi:UNVERIFIED_CONTAM: hypothetical protein Sradi_5466600, partial [Sesamum radiatum]